MTYKVKLIDKKILYHKDLFNDFLDETKIFKYQITVKKYKGTKTEFSPVFFSSTTKTVNFDLEKAFQETLYRIDYLINEGSGWIVESIYFQYINISTFRPLSRSSYIKLPVELKSSKKGIIKIENSDQKCFLWCPTRHINLVKIHPERITQKDQEMISDLDYKGIEFSVSKKDFSKIEVKSKICINAFCFLRIRSEI